MFCLLEIALPLLLWTDMRNILKPITQEITFQLNYVELEEGTRRWLGYIERKVEFYFPQVARVAHSQISQLPYSTERRVWTFGSEHTIVLSAK